VFGERIEERKPRGGRERGERKEKGKIMIAIVGANEKGGERKKKGGEKERKERGERGGKKKGRLTRKKKGGGPSDRG